MNSTLTPLPDHIEEVIHRVPMYPSVTYVESHEPVVSLKSDHCLRLPNGRRFWVGAVPRGAQGRKVSYGPMVPGPWAFATPACTVIDNYPDRRAAERATDIEVSGGSLVKIDGVLYTVRIIRNEFIDLIQGA